jgi:hypothetical protein
MSIRALGNAVLEVAWLWLGCGVAVAVPIRSIVFGAACAVAQVSSGKEVVTDTGNNDH